MTENSSVMSRRTSSTPRPSSGVCKNESGPAGRAVPRLAYALRRAVWSGSVASVLSAMTLMACSKAEGDSAARAINAISHWWWGKPAYLQGRWRLRFSVPGFAIHHASSILWATLYERLSLRDDARTAATVPLARAAAVTVLAYNVDFHLTPSRLTPGFQHVVSKPSLLAVYVAFAAGLALARQSPLRR